MKNIKWLMIAIIIVAIICILTLFFASTVSIGGGDSSWKELWEGGPHCYYGSSGFRYGFLVSDTTAAQYNNIYCIEYGGRLEPGKTVSWWSGNSNLYYVSAVVTITGSASGDGYVQYYDEEGFWFGGNEGVNSGNKLNPGMHNRIIASILNNDKDDNYYGKGMWIGNRNRSTLYIFTRSIVSILEYMD